MRKLVAGTALPLVLIGILIYVSLDQFILRLHVDAAQLMALQLVDPGAHAEKMAGWILQVSLMVPGGAPFTTVFVVFCLVAWNAMRNDAIVRERFHRYAFLVTLILFFFFFGHIVLDDLAVLLLSE
jgi:hypothetical protein